MREDTVLGGILAWVIPETDRGNSVVTLVMSVGNWNMTVT